MRAGDVTQKLSQIRPLTEEEREDMMRQLQAQQAELQKAAQGAQQTARQPETVGAGAVAAASAAAGAAAEGFDENDPSTWGDPGRNEACPCGSGKKFKHCHGRLA